MTNRTGFIYHELFMWHNTGNSAGVIPYGYPVQPSQHVESPESKRRIRNLLEVSGLLKHLVTIEPREATLEELRRVHTPEHIERIRAGSQQPGIEAGPNSPMGCGSYDIARLAAGGVIEAVDAVLDRKVQNAYALVRPPGHHALPDQAMGFCLFANASIAGRHLLDVRGLERIAFVDWDVHHGNGTQAIFWEDPRALTISIHQDRNFPPDSGLSDEIGEGAGRDCNVNIPLPAGSGVGAYLTAFERIVVPLLSNYRPQFIIVPCGFDAGAFDPLGRQMMTADGFRSMTAQLLRVADAVCDGRVVMCHEGGYNADTAPFFGLAVIEELAGRSTNVIDPYKDIFAGLAGQELQPHQEAVIARLECQFLGQPRFLDR